MTTTTTPSGPIPTINLEDISAYISQDGRTVTDWHGNHLGTITSQHKTPLPFNLRTSWVHGWEYSHYTANINGRRYYGKSSPGVIINLHAYKNEGTDQS